MTSLLVSTIVSDDDAIRDRSLDSLVEALDDAALRRECERLDEWRRDEENLYHRVRALLFLFAIHRFHWPRRASIPSRGLIPHAAHALLLDRRYEEAIDRLLDQEGHDAALSSALAEAYHGLAFQTLKDQVRHSVRAVRGNRWMFRVGHPLDHPLRIRRELLAGDPTTPPLLIERTPVRMDLTHSAWSDIFFLGMDCPEGAKVLNVSIDLAVRGRDAECAPPIECSLRVIDRPVLRLLSVDLEASADIVELAEVFDFARDYLGLLKAAVIASGLVPPGLEGSETSLPRLLERLVGPGRGLELASRVRGIPKGSRLAVSTNLLASLITLCMRATRQLGALEGVLEESERRIVAARAILGEWLGGSGGGWQDSGGVWPGMKLIEGEVAREGDPEWGVSRGRLLPRHTLLDRERVSPSVRRKLAESLVLVHGGMAQDVGPILEMVTEKYLLRSQPEHDARRDALGILDEVLEALEREDVRALAKATTRNFHGPLQAIIPWASNHYTEELIRRCEERFGDGFWGFWMLGGMSGGGMGFIFDPAERDAAQEWLQGAMNGLQEELQSALPFAMRPVVYDFRVNEDGTRGLLGREGSSRISEGHRALRRASLESRPSSEWSPLDRADLEAESEGTRPASLSEPKDPGGEREDLDALLAENGFDPTAHESIRAALRAGRIGLAQNRLPVHTLIQDVRDDEVIDASSQRAAESEARGWDALRAGRVAVVSLAAGSGSRWTRGGGVVKALSPFCKLAGRHRSFLDIHLAKTRKRSREAGVAIPHVFTTSYLSHAPLERGLAQLPRLEDDGPVYLSRGRSVGLRLVPMARDLEFEWEENQKQVLDAQAQKVRASLRQALLSWARDRGEGSDYSDNLPAQCLHPVGHWYELPNLLLNGTLARLLQGHPTLTTLLVHNIDTVGADVDPALLGLHLDNGGALSFEVIPRSLEDRGGGLARVDGRPRLVEGLALPREEDEFVMSYYSTLTNWVEIDRWLALFGLERSRLEDGAAVARAVSDFAERMPTYVTLKEVKKRWGLGQEDVFPVAQFEKLWGDMSALPQVGARYLVVPRARGRQLKDPAQLDPWVQEGGAAAVEALCAWPE